MPNDTGLEDERSFTESSFLTDYVYEDLYALAKRLQTLILMEPDTIPNLSNAGVGIRNYLFNFRDDETLNSIRSSIDNQISKFVPNSNIFNITVEKYTNNFNSDSKGVICYFDLYDKKNRSDLPTKIGLSFSKPDMYTEKIISEILL